MSVTQLLEESRPGQRRGVAAHATLLPRFDRLRHNRHMRDRLVLAGLFALALPSRAGVPGCPSEMALVTGTHACIDRWEASLAGGRARARQGVLPAVNVSWREADTACRRAGKRLC